MLLLLRLFLWAYMLLNLFASKILHLWCILSILGTVVTLRLKPSASAPERPTADHFGAPFSLRVLF